MQIGKLEIYKTQHGVRVVVRGNVGADGRAVLDELKMTPVVDISNCREIFVQSAPDLDKIRCALLEKGIIVKPT